MTTGEATARLRSFGRRFGWPLRIALLVAAVALVAWQVDVEALQTAMHPASWGFLFAAVAANAASVICKGYTWKGIVDGLPSMRRRSRIRDLVSPLFVGFLFNTVLAARVGELVKVILARRRLNARGETVRNSTLLGTVVVENLVSTVALVLVIVTIGAFLPLSDTMWATSLALGAACLAIIAVASLRKPGRRRPRWMQTSGLWARATGALHRIWAAVHESHLGLRQPLRLLKVSMPAIGSWLAQLAGIYFALRAFGLDVVGWGGAALLLVSVTVAQIFPVLPGNVGVFQAAVVVPLTHAYPISSANALAFALGLQATEIAVGVAIGFVFLMVEGTSFRELRAEADDTHRPSGLADTLAGP